MSAQNKAVVRRWFDQVWNKGRAESIDELLAEKAVVHGLGAEMRGPAAFKAFFTAYRDAFPDLQIHLDHLVAEDDLVAVHWSATATHKGGGLGFAATGKRVSFGGMALARIDDGKIVEGWNSFDQLGLLQQIGIVNLPS